MSETERSLWRWIASLVLCAGLLPVPFHSVSAETPADLEALDEIVDEVDDLIRDAHFPTAISVAQTARTWADEAGSSPEVRARRARLQVLVATAHVALGQTDLARESLRRALSLAPHLVFDEATTSPKVLAVLRDVPRTQPVLAGASR